MYIPYQFLIAMENDRLRTLERQQLRRMACREAAVSRRTRERGEPSRGLGRRVTRAFGRRPAACVAA